MSEAPTNINLAALFGPPPDPPTSSLIYVPRQTTTTHHPATVDNFLMASSLLQPLPDNSVNFPHQGLVRGQSVGDPKAPSLPKSMRALPCDEVNLHCTSQGVFCYLLLYVSLPAVHSLLSIAETAWSHLR